MEERFEDHSQLQSELLDYEEQYIEEHEAQGDVENSQDGPLEDEHIDELDAEESDEEDQHNDGLAEDADLIDMLPEEIAAAKIVDPKRTCSLLDQTLRDDLTSGSTSAA